MKTCLFLIFYFFTFAASAADYSKCSEYIQKMGFYDRFGGGVGYVPFTLDKEGKISPHKDVSSYERVSDELEEIVYEVPYNYVKQSFRKVKMLVERNDKGEIQKITRDMNFSQSELDNMRKLQVENAKNFTPEGQEFNPERVLFSGVTSKSELAFEVKNGKCVPVERRHEHLREPKVDGKKTSSRDFNLNLCHEIGEFLKENPETKACFDSGLNQKMMDIMKKYLPDNETSSGMNGGFGGGYVHPGGGFNMMHSVGIEGDLREGLITREMGGMFNDKRKKDSRKRMGRSPVIVSHKIYTECQDLGLGNFLEDEEIWEKEKPAVSSDESSDETEAK